MNGDNNLGGRKSGGGGERRKLFVRAILLDVQVECGDLSGDRGRGRGGGFMYDLLTSAEAMLRLRTKQENGSDPPKAPEKVGY